MHNEALRWLQSQVNSDPSLKGRYGIDIGGRNINGGIKNLFDPAGWVALDHIAGSGVDIVADLRTFYPDKKWGLVTCTEVAEHLEGDDLPLLISTLWRCCAKDGAVLFTAAMDPRKPHNSVGVLGVPENEPYCNVDPEKLETAMANHFDKVEMSFDFKHGDVYCIAKLPREVAVP